MSTDIPSNIFKFFNCIVDLYLFEWHLKRKEKWTVAFVSTGEDFGESIHMVPFQFDLIQLLLKCQQVELFFLTFSTGIASLQFIQLVNRCN